MQVEGKQPNWLIFNNPSKWLGGQTTMILHVVDVSSPTAAQQAWKRFEMPRACSAQFAQLAHFC